jgi:plastocyanin
MAAGRRARSRVETYLGRGAAAALGAGVLALVMARPQPAASRSSGAVAGEVSISDQGLFGASQRSDRSGVVVYLEQVPGTARPARAVIRQHEKAFLPRVTAVAVGSSVDFPNDDRIFHNVFSLSQAAKFDLGLYKSGVSRAVTFQKPGVIDVYCNIHPEMAATIKVVEGPAFAVTGPDGRFRIDDVPDGTYPFVAWQRDGDEQRGSVTVKGGETATLKIGLHARKTVERHLRKDGTPYGRYQ